LTTAHGVSTEFFQGKIKPPDFSFHKTVSKTYEILMSKCYVITSFRMQIIPSHCSAVQLESMDKYKLERHEMAYKDQA